MSGSFHFSVLLTRWRARRPFGSPRAASASSLALPSAGPGSSRGRADNLRWRARLSFGSPPAGSASSSALLPACADDVVALPDGYYHPAREQRRARMAPEAPFDVHGPDTRTTRLS